MAPLVLSLIVAACGGKQALPDALRLEASSPPAADPGGVGPAAATSAPLTEVAPGIGVSPPEDAQRSSSGLAWTVVERGPGGPTPSEAAKVTVHYTGWTTDGRLFDSSLQRGVPATFGLNQVIEGWTEGLQLMSVGDTFRFWIPEDLAYKGRAGAPWGLLIFEVSLLGISEPQRPMPVDVAAPPASAQRSDSGLAWRVLERAPAPGGQPGPNSQVTVHYAGWTTDGTQFDSSWDRGAPVSLRLNQVIEGWAEGLQLMSVGDTFRFWIPEDLAYEGKPGRPPGMLVFDVALLSLE
ncbi:MAG TPA: peptidylprolyl isomerase [Deltaproteobacteria bacterium]|nr:peptidylprolyl isomerase [Deltaproteobacteria bacterium]